jgi:hypothetical protein
MRSRAGLPAKGTPARPGGFHRTWLGHGDDTHAGHHRYHALRTISGRHRPRRPATPVAHAAEVDPRRLLDARPQVDHLAVVEAEGGDPALHIEVRGPGPLQHPAVHPAGVGDSIAHVM